eukprot:c7260_g1_i1.p1 GENE.c7260_g1_i1~~c7260_g1_i1.p1  ORF type:complete len:286 (-),score=55.47 c7260_g1_i1:171-1028(-)
MGPKKQKVQANTDVRQAKADQDTQPEKQERVMVLTSRNASTRHRHLMSDLLNLLPHSKKEGKTDPKDRLPVINELCELRSCSSCIYLEVRRKNDLYLWFSRCPTGPSVKFHLLNVHTMLELRMTGNCLKGSRPILSFDSSFDQSPHTALIKQIFTQIFATPRGHPHSKPFVDHVLSFSYLDNKIWFRNYQIVWPIDAKSEMQLIEIGPRFVLSIVRIFQGSFQGATLYANPKFVAPVQMRRLHQKETGAKYAERVQGKEESRKRKLENVQDVTELDTMFDDDDDE